LADNSTALAAVVLVLASTALGGGLVLLAHGTLTTTSTTTVQGPPATVTNSSAPYVLTLLIATNNAFNSTVGDQPAYFIVGPNGLESSANITIPAHHLIELIVMNFDQGNATLTDSQYANVSGTMGGMISIYSNELVNSTQGPNGIMINGTQQVSSLPPSLISHTFTVPALGLNVPMESESTVVAYFNTGAPGSYLWFCGSECGSGATGLGGAMTTPGWMTGALNVT